MQKSAIDRALDSLRSLNGAGASSAETPAASTPAKRKGGMTPAGKKRLVAALKKRWAAKKAEAVVVEAPAPPVPSPKRRLTPEGRRRLAAAMKKRWVEAKAAGTTLVKVTKKAGRKAKAA